MEQQNNRQALKIYSTLFILFALIDIIKTIARAVQGDYNPELLSFAYDMPEKSALIAAIAGIALTAAVIAIELFLGIRGLNRADSNVRGGKGYITLAKIVFVPIVVLLVIQVAALVLSMSGSTVIDWMALATPVASTIIVSCYISSAKKVEAEINKASL